MGGMNHQPCSNGAFESTRLSRHLSSAVASINLANVKLEDLIIDELDIAFSASCAPIVIHLQGAQGDLVKALASKSALAVNLRSSNFIDCKDFKKLQQILENLCAKGFVERHFGQLVIEDRRDGGFLQCLEMIDDRLTEISSSLDKLIQGFKEMDTQRPKKELLFSHLEFNTALSIKPQFAQVYTDLVNLMGYFLASAIISTEIFYDVANFGKLGEPVTHSDLPQVHEDFINGTAIDRLVTNA